MPFYNRICRPLVLFEDQDGYRVFRNKHAQVYVQRLREYNVAVLHVDGREPYKYWEILTGFDTRHAYIVKSRSAKLRLNKELAERGRAWIEHWKLLMASPLWEVRCENWDGLGTPCPIAREVDGERRCSVQFFFEGYAGAYPADRPLPGRCDGPLNNHYWRNPCVPCEKDEHGFSMATLAEIRYEIRAMT